MNPSETKGTGADEPEEEEKQCPTCGMEQRDWSSAGYRKAGESYCCQGCSEGTGCTCEATADEDEEPSRSRSRSR